jgi:hypothetical protein
MSVRVADQAGAALLLTMMLGAGLGCGAPARVQSGATPKHAGALAPPSQPTPLAGAAAKAASDEDALRARDELPPERRALLHLEGVARWVDAAAIEAAGYTLIDLSDAWTPLIFVEHTAADGVPLPNRYRRVFQGLANDQLDSDGEPLEPGEKNYLELYGVFPSLSVLRARFLEDAAQPCHDQESVAVLEAVESVTYVAPKDLRRSEQRIAAVARELDKARQAAKLATLEELVARRPALAAKLELVKKRAAEKAALAAVERRLSCEKLLSADSKHQPGAYDEPMRLAVRSFQQKHMIYEASFLRRRTVDALARSLLDNDYDALVRVLRERVVSAAGVIEDGTAGTEKAPARDLVGEYTQATLQQLGLVDAQAALAFFERYDQRELATLRAAVKLPARPSYHAPHMDLSLVIDRGDVWYDLPFDAQGNFRQHVRSRYPSMSLYVTHEGKKTRLARWRTTIGGWRAEQASDGYEYYRYKMSDVGPRVIRQVIAGPVWIAPSSTPIRSLIKHKTVHHQRMKIVNYDELGPGYLSAYGLVAGYFVTPGKNGRPDRDDGIRAHGSSDYLSLYSATGFSHGCHRLPNHIAIRLYSFMLRHRHKTVAGDQPISFTRQFLAEDMVYEIKIPSRGYAYNFDPPVPVEVLPGEIKGAVKKPIIGYIPKPNTVYPGPPPPAPDSPESKAGGE